jgi:hypothetical protein
MTKLVSELTNIKDKTTKSTKSYIGGRGKEASKTCWGHDKLWRRNCQLMKMLRLSKSWTLRQ